MRPSRTAVPVRKEGFNGGAKPDRAGCEFSHRLREASGLTQFVQTLTRNAEYFRYFLSAEDIGERRTVEFGFEHVIPNCLKANERPLGKTHHFGGAEDESAPRFGGLPVSMNGVPGRDADTR